MIALQIIVELYFVGGSTDILTTLTLVTPSPTDST